jgi:hypothetical protein
LSAQPALATRACTWHGTAVAWTIVEIETAALGWRTRGGPSEDGAPVAVWALVENEVGERFIVGIEPTVEGVAGPGGRLIDVNRLIAEIDDGEGGYAYRAPVS